MLLLDVITFCRRVSSLRNLNTKTRCLNLGSYNYLGFAEEKGPCADAAIESIHEYGAGTNSSRVDLGKSYIRYSNTFSFIVYL